MSRSLGTLTLNLIAKIAGFTEPLDKASRVAADKLKKIQKEAAQVGAAIGTMSVATATAVTAMVTMTANAAAELTKFSAVAGSTVDEFQRYAAGANALGTSNEKLADIFKDVNDKVGDFMQTGAGAMADFFEQIAPKVGVTAEQFKNLSGPQSLGLYVDSLEKAKVSQAEMTFYLEAIASDTTALLPLLRDGGEGFKVFAAEADRMGTILNDSTIEEVSRLKAANWLLSESISGVRIGIATELMPVLADISSVLSDTSTNTSLASGAGEIFSMVIRSVAASAVGAVAAIDMLGKGIGGIAAVIDAATETESWWENLIPGRTITNIIRNTGKAKDVFNVAVEDLAETADRYAAVISGIWRAGGEESGNETSSRLDALAKYFDQMRVMAGSSSKVVDENSESIKKNKKLIDELTRSFQSVADRLDPSTAALNKYNSEQKILFSALDKGLIDLQRYDQLMSGLDTEFFDSLLLDVDSIGKGVKEVESIYTGMFERISGAGADVFVNWMTGAEDALGGLKDLAIRTIAEIANEALLTPIVLNVQQSMTGKPVEGASGGGIGSAIGAMGMGGIYAAAAVVAVSAIDSWNKDQDKKFAEMTAEFRQGNQSTGTLLGLANAKSDSIANVLGDMDSKYSDVLSVNYGMYQALVDIRAGIAGVASGFARSFSYSGALDGVKLGNSLGGSDLEKFRRQQHQLTALASDPWGAVNSKLFEGNFLGEIAGFTGGFLTGIMEKVSKNIYRESRKIKDSGIQIVGASLADILSSGTIEAFSYADIETKKKVMGITASTKLKTTTESMGDLFQSQLAGVFENAADALKISSTTYGIDFDSLLGRLVIDPMKLSLKDLEGDAIAKEIEHFLSSTMDGWAQTSLAGTDVLERYQQVGEGAFETMVRLSTQTEQFRQQLGFVGLELDLTGVSAVKAAQDIAGYAGGFDTLSGSLSAYYDKFFTDAEKFENLTAQLAGATGGILDSLPETTAQFREIIAAIDNTTEAGQKQFAALINLSGPMYEYIKGLEDQRSALADFMTGYEDQITNFGLSEFEQQMRSLGAAFNDAIAQAQSLGASEQQLSAIRAASQMDVVRLLSTQTDNSMSRLNDSIASQITSIQSDAAARIAALQSDANARVSGANSWMQSQLNHYQRQISLVGESINQLNGLSDAIKSAIDAINPVTEISRLINYGSAVDRLSALTSTALAGNGLPTADIINQLSGAMQGNSQYYSSYEDWIVATAGITANLDALAGVTETQLTADEKMLASLEASMAQAERHNSAVVGSINSGIESQIAAINAQMEADIAEMEKQRLEAEEQIAAMRGIDTSVLSVEEAVKQLSAAMQSESQNRLQQEAQMNAELLQELRNMNRSNGALANQVERLEIHLRNAS